MGGNVEAALQQGGKGEVSWFYSEPRSWKSKGTPAMPPPKKEVLIRGLYYPLCFLGVGGIVRAILKFPWQDDSVFFVFLLCSEVLPFWWTEVTPQKTEHDNGTTNHLEMYLLLSKMVDFFPAIAMLGFQNFPMVDVKCGPFSGYLIGPSTEVPFPSMDFHPAAVGWFFPQQWAPTWKRGRPFHRKILTTPQVLWLFVTSKIETVEIPTFHVLLKLIFGG